MSPLRSTPPEWFNKQQRARPTKATPPSPSFTFQLASIGPELPRRWFLNCEPFSIYECDSLFCFTNSWLRPRSHPRTSTTGGWHPVKARPCTIVSVVLEPPFSRRNFLPSRRRRLCRWLAGPGGPAWGSQTAEGEISAALRQPQERRRGGTCRRSETATRPNLAWCDSDLNCIHGSTT